MQKFAGLVGLVLLVVGYGMGGWRGLLTGLVTSLGVGSGLAIFIGEQGTGVDSVATGEGRAQRVGGLVAAGACLVGVLVGGWAWGWMWGTAGYLLGVLTAVGLGVWLGRRRGI